MPRAGKSLRSMVLDEPSLLSLWVPDRRAPNYLPDIAALDAKTPDQLSGLALWLKAETLASGYANGAAVDTWRDVSGNDRDLAQGVAANRPTMQTNVLNGYPVVRFDGVNDALIVDAGANIVSGTELTAIVVYKRISDTVNDERIIAADDGAGGDDNFGNVFRLTLAAIGNRLNLYRNGIKAEHPAAANGTWAIASGLFDGANGSLYANGIQASSTFATASTGAFAVRRVCLGANPNQGAQWGNIDIAEVLLYNRALSHAEKLEVEAYLGIKYGLSYVALSPLHAPLAAGYTIANPGLGDKAGRRLTLDGASGYGNIASLPAGRQARTRITLEALIRCGDPSRRQDVIDFGHDTCELEVNGGNVGARRQSGTQTDANGGVVIANALAHIAGTYDAANLRAYLNGANTATTAATGAIDNAITGNIGVHDPIGPTSFFQGDVEMVAMYGDALAAATLLAHAQAARAI